jgi:dUTP pyrophosphatase
MTKAEGAVMLIIQIQADDLATLPLYAHEHDAGADLSAALRSPLVIYQNETKRIPTGLRVAIPPGYEWQIRSRSGLASKGIFVTNSPGTIDAGFRGEVAVLLTNLGDQPFTVNPGMRIAQAVLAPVLRAEFMVVDSLPDTERGTGGFGSSGV